MARARVLVADDSATIQKVFELAFEKEDIDVSLAGGGREALRMALELRPDIVIADVNMPDMDGFELCRMIKANGETSSIPVYLLSSALDDFDEDMARDAGASGRFEKPFRSEDMVSQVMNVIDPGAQAGLEDTFEDVDIPEDSMLEAVELIESDDGEELAGKDIEPVSDTSYEPAPPPKVINLSAESLVEDDVEEEDFGLEVVSGGEDILDREEYEVIEPRPGDEDALVMGEFEQDEGLESEPGADEMEAAALDTTPAGEQDETTEDEYEESGAAPDDDSGLSEEARRLLREIDEASADEAAIAAGLGRPASGASGGEDVFPAAALGEKMERRIDAAIEDIVAGLDSGRVIGAMEAAVRRAVEDKISYETIDAAVAKSIREAVMAMRPEIIEIFRKVAADITLNIAEDMVKQTIEQIKSGG